MFRATATYNKYAMPKDEVIYIEPEIIEERAELVPRRELVSDAELFDLINKEDSDLLRGLSFEDAVLHEPLLVEGQMHQLVNGAFRRAMGNMHPMAAETYKLRNNTLRNVHGEITPMNIADALDLNWRQFSQIFQAQAGMARMGHPAGIMFLNALQANADSIRRAFRQASMIALSASAVAREAGKDEDVQGWGRMSAVWRDMSDFIEQIMAAPALPRRAQRRALRGERPRHLDDPMARFRMIEDNEDEDL
tara:strand:+ start:135 stop:884 length:750 start_codon:yes stop_codon:yes gene_type:complete